jgi:hypothetical protein
LLAVSPPDSPPVASHFNSHRKIEKAQNHGCNVKPIDAKKWEDIARRLLYLEKIFALGIGKKDSHLTLRVDGKTEPLTPEQFLRVIQPAAWKGITKRKPLLRVRRGF